MPTLSPNTFPDKHPDTNRPYNIDWTEDLPPNEKVAGSVWDIEGDDAILVMHDPAFTDFGTSVWLQAGTLGKQYRLTNTITTNAVPPKTLVSVKLINIRDEPCG